MKCNRCPLNIASESFNPKMYEPLPMHARSLFVCRNAAKTGVCGDLFAARQLCARDLWVLAFIGRRDCFASASAGDTLDRLVGGGHSELLCHLFENADYETRRDLWARMTSNHPDRLYMFDAMFEKECLAPVASGELPEDLHVYRHHLLYAGTATNQLLKDL
ncbi:MAG: hypothetical protein CVV41_08060 [Candidatus Riflebacteria bacterium HGW-Riflebacteria-1]|jgi:hypothetical protein|nr:MAG: hypothetical protein CVV41_08060 [Candidatus Riflebacteria bacterium HGW-Riflebacteria-1]